MRELKLKIEMQYPVVKELYTENYFKMFLEGLKSEFPQQPMFYHLSKWDYKSRK